MDRDKNPVSWLQFSGKEEDFGYWSEKFEAFMHQKKLRAKLLGIDEAATEDDRYNIWSWLVQCLDKRSVLMLRAECRGNGPMAWNRLKAHFSSTETPRVMNLLSEFTNLHLKPGEEIVDYLIRAEELGTQLEEADEKVSEMLLTSVVLNGLPPAYDYFKTVHNFESKEKKQDFTDVKKALKNFAQSKANKAEPKTNTESFLVSKTFGRKPPPQWGTKPKFSGKCRRCTKVGHKEIDCRVHKCGHCGKLGHKQDRCFKLQKPQTPKAHHCETSETFEEEFNFLTGDSAAQNQVSFVVDSGSTSHMFFDRKVFATFSSNVDQECINANGSKSSIAGAGTVHLKLYDVNNNLRNVKLSNCLYIPDRTRNLLSVSKLADAGAKVSLGGPDVITCNGATFPISREGNLYVINGVSAECSHLSISSQVWHQRLGHNNFTNVHHLQNATTGMKVLKESLSCHCDVCAEAKAKKQSCNKECIPRKDGKLELVYSDVQGPMQTPSMNGMRYAVSFIDCYSRYGRVYFMKTKSETFEKFKRFCAEEGYPRALRSDNGGEYISKEFNSFCVSKGIRQELTTPHSPHQNGVAERRWRTVVEMSRCLLRTAHLPNEFWVRAMETAFYITNRCLSSSLPKGKTPIEMWTGNKPDVGNMKIFGCAAFRFIEGGTPKLENNAMKEIFVGYAAIAGSYVLFNRSTRQFHTSRNVTFNENDFPGSEPVISEQVVPTDLPLDFGDDNYRTTVALDTPQRPQSMPPPAIPRSP
jgi:hypothetical protein